MFYPSIDAIPATDWNTLDAETNPFVRHEFLAALEHQRCVGEGTGWQPHYLAVHDDNRIVGALPLFRKDDSYGEFVFDWSWASAYERAGMNYYPKLVVAAPFTPVTGRRLLIRETGARRNTIATLLINAAIELARDAGMSSLHWLFTNEADNRELINHGLLERLGYQYHWYNRQYRDFEDFLDEFSSKKRKNVHRDRRQVQETGIECEVLYGDDITEQHWNLFYTFYTSTMWRKGNINALTPGFFRELGHRMPDNVLLVMAKDGSEYIGGAFFMRSQNELFGRYWGCSRAVQGLHFEVCYYRPIEYCIEQGLARFEAGAQGEHKIDRGFVPTVTRSAHWIANPAFRAAIEDFLRHERVAVRRQMELTATQTPFKQVPSTVCEST